jgi:glycosyltransferase involved in cell wall biosynthesis
VNGGRVWILNHYAQEPNGSGGTRHFHLLHKLRDQGWTGTIIAGSVELNTGRQRLRPGEDFREEKIDGVSFLWLRVPTYEGNGIGRIKNMVGYHVRAVRRKYTNGMERPSAIIGSSVHPLAGLAGLMLARRFRVPFVFEVRDLWPQTLIDMGTIQERSWIAWGLRRLEIFLYRRAERIIVLLPKAADYIAPLGIRREKIVWIPNGVDLALFGDVAPKTSSKPGRFVLMYLGAHGEANGLDGVLRAMALIANDPRGKGIHLRLIGDGPQKRALQDKAARMGLTNVSFEAPIPKNRVPEVAGEADAFVFSLVDAPVFKYGISSNKLFDFMAVGRPVIFSCDAGNNPIDEAGAGITVRPQHPESLAKGILDIASIDEADRCSMGRAGRRYIEDHHDFEQLARKLASMLDDICA